MNDIIKNLIFLTQDQITFWILQGIISSVFIYALIHKHSGMIIVKRGEKATRYFYHFASSFISTILVVVISITDVAHGYKVFIFLIDVMIVLYLSFLNDWSRNKLVGIYSWMEQKKEKH